MSDNEPIHCTYLRTLQDLASEHSVDVAFQAAALTIEFLLASSCKGFHRSPQLPLIVPADIIPADDKIGGPDDE